MFLRNVRLLIISLILIQLVAATCIYANYIYAVLAILSKLRSKLKSSHFALKVNEKAHT